jgi:hypothetical protein
MIKYITVVLLSIASYGCSTEVKQEEKIVVKPKPANPVYIQVGK